jgi:hypothetical protein
LCLDPTTVRCCIQALLGLLALKPVWKEGYWCAEWRLSTRTCPHLFNNVTVFPLSFCTFLLLESLQDFSSSLLRVEISSYAILFTSCG